MEMKDTYFLTLQNTGEKYLFKGRYERYRLQWHLTPYETDFKALQRQVGGNFDHWDVFTPKSREWAQIHAQMHIDSWINDDGKLLNLPPTIPLIDPHGEMYDIIVGNICFLRSDEMGESYGLTLSECRSIIDSFESAFSIPFGIVPEYASPRDSALLLGGEYHAENNA